MNRLASLRAPGRPPRASGCPNPGCPSPNIVDDDGQRVCAGCGTVLSDANIVSEISFGENASGAAVVQGTFVGADQAHGRGAGPGFQRANVDSREMTEQHGGRYIASMARQLNIPESASKAAGQVFKLAVGLNFIQGRRTRTVAAICLYVACRRQDGNTTMLIDFADILQINVFKLGRTYKALLDELRLGGNVFIMNPVDPESLIYRFAKQLEFGATTMHVASEAVRIVQRMSRDWMLTGRRPAGICGAALILAARMNNFRRTVREVVYIVKVTELTIHQRLNEFKATESGDLTVDQFRSVQLEGSSDPPAFTRSKEGRRRQNLLEQQREQQRLQQQAPRLDADGFAIPALPGADANGIGPRRGRPRAARPPPPTVSASQMASESALEHEMTTLLHSSLLEPSENEYPQTQKHQQLQQHQQQQKQQDQPPSRPPVSTKPEIDPTEFDSDPEVANCLLSAPEADIKERIWVHENKDYLRTQQAKALKRALAAADNPDGVERPRKTRKRRRGRLGDVRYLEGGGGADAAGGADGDSDAGSVEGGRGRATTPAEAARRMLEKRGFSKKINYRLFEGLYGRGKEGDDGGESGSGDEDGRSDVRSVQSSRSRSASVGLSRSLNGGGRLQRLGSLSRDRTREPSRTPPATSTIRIPGQQQQQQRRQQQEPTMYPAVPAKPTTIPSPRQSQPSQLQQPTPPSTLPAAAPASAGREQKSPGQSQTPLNASAGEEILGFIDGGGATDTVGADGGRDDGGEDDDFDDDGDEDEEEDDGVDAAFAGTYGGGGEEEEDDYDYGDDGW